jgi:hypothetical protein
MKEQEINPIEKLSYQRTEERWNISANNIPEVLENLAWYEKIDHPNSWVTTIYFGGVKKNDQGDEIIVPLHDARVCVKARTFSKTKSDNPIEYLSPSDEYRLDIKMSPLGDLQSPLRKKYSVTASLKSINDALFHGNTDAFQHTEIPIQTILSNILLKSGCTHFVPIAKVEYKRHHYVNSGIFDGTEGQRITIDTDFSLWDIDWTGYQYAAVKVKDFAQGILEIKNKGGIKAYPEDLKTLVSKFEKAPSKHDIVFNTIDHNVGLTVEVENKDFKGGWYINEIERKLDVQQDPRIWLTNVTTTYPLLFINPEEQLTRQQFFLLKDPKQSACIVEYPLIIKDRMIKTKIQKDMSPLDSRLELAQTDNPDARKRVSRFLGKDISTYPLSESFHRNRVLRTLINCQSGRVYEVVADNCVSNDDRADLNQVEIEYIGKLTGCSQTSLQSIDEELTDMEEWVKKSLEKNNLTILPTRTTKNSWITEEIH